MSTIVIVGAGPQMGRAIGKRFAAERFDVALIARDRAKLESIAAEIPGAGVFPADVADPDGLRAALDAAEERFGPIDVLEYSPGPTPADLGRAPIVEATRVTVESIASQLDLYLYGGVTAIQHVLPGMIARGSGTILVTSGAGSGPMIIPQVANAQIAAAGLRNWILNLHAALDGTGVYAAHLALAAYIGQGRPASEPAAIADAYWRLHTTRTEPELFYNDLPGGFEGLSDRFAEPA